MSSTFGSFVQGLQPSSLLLAMLRTNWRTHKESRVPALTRPMLHDGTLGKPHCSKSTTVKVLGVVWDPGEDNLQFISVADITKVAAATEPPKRMWSASYRQVLRPAGILS